MCAAHANCVHDSDCYMYTKWHHPQCFSCCCNFKHCFFFTNRILLKLTENWLCMCIYSVSIIGIKNRLVMHLGFGSPLSRRDKLMSTWWVPFSQQQGGVFPVDEGSGLLGARDPGGTVPAAAWAMAAQRVLHDGESWNRSVSHGCCEQSETFQQRERSVSWYMYTVSYI